MDPTPTSPTLENFCLFQQNFDPLNTGPWCSGAQNRTYP